jgi:hypothetical protein
MTESSLGTDADRDRIGLPDRDRIGLVSFGGWTIYRAAR